MTVNTTALSVSGPYNTDGSTTSFAITFQYLEDSDIVASLLNKTTSATIIGTLNSDYSIADNTPPTIGGNVTILAHAFGSIANGSGQIPAGYTLTFNQNIPLTQVEDYPEGGVFPSAATTQALDKLTLIDQQQAVKIQYSVQAPVTDVNPQMTLPPASIRTGKYLGFDANGNPVVTSSVGTTRGVWETNTIYNFGDLVQDGINGLNTQNYYVCLVPNTSGVWATDLANGDWLLAVNYQAALISLSGTSVTAQTIGIGSKTFASQPGKQWVAGQFLMIASNANVANFLHGQVTSYDPVAGTLVMNIVDNGGSGTHTDWVISVSAQKGATGATGSAIPIVSAGGTSDVITATYNPAITSLTDGLVVLFTASAANTTTTPTFSPNGLPAHVITKNGGSALAPGDIPAATAVCQLEYNLAGTRWELVDTNIFNEGNLSLSDVTTNNASTSKHGFMPKGSGTTTNYFGGDNAEHALPVLKSFISAGQTITSGATTTLAHGLGSVPKLFTFYLKCLAGEAGYSIGDTVLISPNTMDGSTNRGFSAYFDSTNVYVIWAASGGANQIFIIDKSAAIATPISNTNWELHVGAFA